MQYVQDDMLLFWFYVSYYYNNPSIECVAWIQNWIFSFVGQFGSSSFQSPLLAKVKMRFVGGRDKVVIRVTQMMSPIQFVFYNEVAVVSFVSLLN